MSEDKSKLKRTVVEISAAVLVVLAIFGLALAFHFRVIPMPHFMRVIFGTDYSEREPKKSLEDEIPDIRGPGSALAGSEVYFDLTPAELFGLLEEEESYSCNLRMISVYDSRRSSERLKLVKSGVRFRAEGEDRLIIFDGNELYTLTAGKAYRAKVTGDCDCYTELGITSLAELKKADVSEENLTLSSDYREMGVTFYDEEGNLTDEYKISVESGIVTEEYHYSGTVVYRSAVRENIVVGGGGEENFVPPADATDVTE